MILDAIAVFFAALVEALAGAVMVVIVPVANLGLLVAEAVVGLFVAGFQLGRLGARKPGKASLVMSVVFLGLVGWFFLGPILLNRNLALVAPDGHSLPFAALVVQTKDGVLHMRTDKAGNATIPRFGLVAVTVKDPRYVEKTWERDEIGPQMEVQRTLLGSGLDALAGELLKPADR